MERRREDVSYGAFQNNLMQSGNTHNITIDLSIFFSHPKITILSFLYGISTVSLKISPLNSLTIVYMGVTQSAN